MPECTRIPECGLRDNAMCDRGRSTIRGYRAIARVRNRATGHSIVNRLWGCSAPSEKFMYYYLLPVVASEVRWGVLLTIMSRL